jgi:N-acetylmuramoyl-L-alanine amidase
MGRPSIVWLTFSPRALIAVLAGLMGHLCYAAESRTDKGASVWHRLEAFSGDLSAARFGHLLEALYSPDGGYRSWIHMDDSEVRIKESGEKASGETIVYFSPGSGDRSEARRYWRTRSEIGVVDSAQPLAGVRIGLDPGHIGGAHALMEERSFRIDGGPPMREGDLTLMVARILREKLVRLGARVWLVREDSSPVTEKRPEDLRDIAASRLEQSGSIEAYANPEIREEAVEKMSEWLFYRVSEIQSRAKKVNVEIQPDFVIALHFNAAAGQDGPDGPADIQAVDENHLDIIVNGAYLEHELDDDRIRNAMFFKLFQQTAKEEIPFAEAIADTMAEATGLPAFSYAGPNASRVGNNPYVWARNLMANRLYECPVIYLEPYVLNNREVISRVIAGDFEGEKMVAGKMRKSLFREYADGVVAGILRYYRQ